MSRTASARRTPGRTIARTWLNRSGQVLAAGIALVSLGAAAQTPPVLGQERARLLLTRTGFAPSEAEASRWAELTQAQAVDRLLTQTTKTANRPPPAWVDEAIVKPRDLRAMSDTARKQERQTQVRYGLELRAWWLAEMATTPTPLTERMTLFWHNHFVSAQPKVRYAQLMYRQNVLLRNYAVRNIGALLHAVAHDPAMLIYLDTVTNRREAPNENFAREVMELFTLGEGNYSEVDVKEAARAFSGWSVDPDRTTFVFRPRLHDDGEKVVLGRRGAWQGDDVLDILLAQPATAEFIVRKLWLEFVSPRPDPERVHLIARHFSSSGYEIRVALRELFLQPELVERDQDNALVKSPVELAIGMVRQSGGELARPDALAATLVGMGQNLFSPPNVRGWPGGDAWITTQSLLARKQFLETSIRRANAASSDDMLRGMDAMAPSEKSDVGAARPFERQFRRLAQLRAAQIDLAGWLKSAGVYPERAVGEQGATNLAHNLVVLPPLSAPAAEALGVDALRALLLDPVYQLK
ncbi:MAG TPA: DUF1800 domain-containing protein [Burkholderiaceae bacterium]|nr:DUF1800 domain-containing protein [Burkholderiaceae bacterium]